MRGAYAPDTGQPHTGTAGGFMNIRYSRALKLIAAYLLDARIGDPENYPHPVRLMGRSIELLEERLRPVEPDEVAEVRAGFMLAGTVVGGAYLCALLALLLPGRAFMETLLLYTTLARKDLEISALRVAKALEEGDVQEARSHLKALVGRDPEHLDEYGICRAVVESVAENLVDGVLAPLLWAAEGGAPAALAFKAVSTLDSMIGHRDRKYLYLGKFAARLDDMAVLAAARASIPLIAAAAGLYRYNLAAVIQTGLRYRRRHESPNSAHAEAAFAGALGLKLGGPSIYGGSRRDLPEIGDGSEKAEPRHIHEAVKLMNLASLLGLGVAVILSVRRGR
jgi:adenosylcobinamide-phosphate synthase